MKKQKEKKIIQEGGERPPPRHQGIRRSPAVGNATSGGHEFATTGSSGGESSWPPDPMVPWLTEVVGDGERGVEAAAAARKEQRYGVGDDGRARRGGVDVSLARCAEATTTRED